MESIHSGHRDRMKTKYREHGLESFTDIEAVELLLTYALPRRETNTLAHALLDRFRGLRGLMQAQTREIAEVPGVGENAAALITLVRELNLRYLRRESARGACLLDSAAAGRYLLSNFLYSRDEKAVLLTLDNASRVIRCHILAEGSSDQVVLSARDIVSCAMRDDASRVILAHNHGSGLALPSREDIVTTARIRAALQLIGVQLSDHLIFSDDDWVSMRDSGCLDGEELTDAAGNAAEP